MVLAKLDPFQLRPLGGELVLHRGELGLAFGDTAVQLPPPVVQIVGPPRLRVAFGGLLRQAGGAGQHPFRADIHVQQFDPVVGEHELPHLIRIAPSPVT